MEHQGNKQVGWFSQAMSSETSIWWLMFTSLPLSVLIKFNSKKDS